MADTLGSPGDALRAELARLRVRANLSGLAMAKRLGIGQATVWRIENGVTRPKMGVVVAWLDAVDIAPEEKRRLLDLAERAHGVAQGWGVLLDRDGHAQRDVIERERTSRSIRNFQPTVVPGLLQTPEYARAILALGRPKDVEAAVADRVERQKILSEPDRSLSFLIAENVLRWPLGGPQVLAAQRDWLVSLARRPGVDVAVLPAGAVVAAPWSNFILWEPDEGPVWVSAELAHGAVEVFQSEDVARYEVLWSRLWDAAARGDEAVDLIRRG